MSRIFKPTYRDRKTGERRESDTYHVAFKDHMGRRQRVAGHPDRKRTYSLALRLEQLVDCRQANRPAGDELAKWVETVPAALRERLAGMGLIEEGSLAAERPLVEHLDGVTDAATGLVTLPGWRQWLAAGGNTPAHVRQTVDRVRRVLDGCGLVYFKDLARPATPAAVAVFLAGLRESGRTGGADRRIAGRTYNYYVARLKGFCRWMVNNRRAAFNPMEALETVKNADADKVERRPLSVEEVRWLLRVTAASKEERLGLDGAERSMLYRFAFETGMRPGQIRALKVADFNIGADADPPTVTAAAATVKRRKRHTQVLRPALAAELRRLFASKLPGAAAFKVPGKFFAAGMLRADLADARAQWVDGAGGDAGAREARGRSDFLAAVNHQGERADFYSLRHSHGTALGDAGVPQKAIAASLHHTRTATTDRYVHTDRVSLTAAVGALPDVSPEPQRQEARATGTDGPVPAGQPGDCLRGACATGQTDTDSDGLKGGGGENENPLCEAETRVGQSDRWELNPQEPDSQSGSGHSNSPEKQGISAEPPECLRTACATTPPGTPSALPPDLIELMRLWPSLSAASKGAVLAVARASVAADGERTA